MKQRVFIFIVIDLIILAAGVWWFLQSGQQPKNSTFETDVWGFGKTTNAAGETVSKSAIALKPGASVCVYAQGWSSYRELSWAKAEARYGSIDPNDATCLNDKTYPLEDRGGDWKPFVRNFRYTAPATIPDGGTDTITSRLRSEQSEGSRPLTVTIEE